MDELDPRRLYELSESLSELTGAVRYTGEAMQSMLGPQSEVNKKLKKSGNKRAEVEQQAAEQAQTSVSKNKQIDNEEKKLFEQQLRSRGYQIDQTGKLVKTTVDLSKANKESLEVLDKRIAKERELAEYAKDPAKAFRNVARKVDSFEGVMGEMQEKLFEMTGKNAAMAMGLTAATAVITGVSKAAFGMADALVKGERGAKVGAQAVKDLSESVSQAAYGIGAALLFIPGLGVVTRILGVAIAAFGLATEGAAKLAEMGAEYNDKVYDSFNALSEVGLATSAGMSGVSNTLEKLNLTSAEIEKFNTLLVTGSKDLAIFGGTAASGLDKFAGVANQITGLEGPAKALNAKLMMLGITSDEQREHTLKYMATQTRMGMVQGKTQADLVKGATAYMEELDRIATITGIGRKEQEEAQKQVLAIEELRAAMYQAERSGDTKRQRELEQAMKYSTRLMAEGRKKEAAGVAKYYAAGKNVIDAESAMAMQNSAGAIKAISEGKVGEDIYQAGIVSAMESARRVAGTKAIGGDVSAQVGDFNATLDAIKRSEKLQEEARKLGLTPESYAKKLQEEREKSTDETLKNNVALAQIQQQTGMTLDQVARSMDGVGISMAASVKSFNDAVNLFARSKTEDEQRRQSEATGSHGIGGIGAEATAIANANSELNEKQIEILRKAQAEYRAAVKNGTTMQKYFGANLDAKMQEAKDRLKLAESGNLSEGDLGGGNTSAAPASAGKPASAAATPAKAPPVTLKSSSYNTDISMATESASDSVPINIARQGGIFSGPDTNSVSLSSNNMSASDILSSMRESFSSVQKKSVESELPNLSKFNSLTNVAGASTSKKSNSMDVLEKFTEILEQKFTDVIDAISENNNIKEEILLYSKA